MLSFREFRHRATTTAFGNPYWTDELGRPAAVHRVQAEATAYCVMYRLPMPNHDVYVECDQFVHGRIADAYDALPMTDGRSAVAEAYQTLATEVQQQFRFAQANGMTFEPAPTSGDGDVYGGDAFKTLDDIRDHRHLYFFTGGEPNRYMAKIDVESGLPINDLFRAIHDYFGHSAIGADFGPIGEENAWAAHSQMFTMKARRALTVETRGQNSWVNFGRQNYDKNGNYLDIPPTKRPFAVQKTAIFDGVNEWINALPRGVQP
jgi:hypothetical protein